MAHISPSDFTNRQDSATVQRTVQKSKIWGGSEFEAEDGRSDVGILDYHVKVQTLLLCFYLLTRPSWPPSAVIRIIAEEKVVEHLQFR